MIAIIPLIAMIRKDLRLFFSDRRAVIVGFVVPIAIASFFGSIFDQSSRSGERARIDVAIVDQDNSTISRAIVTGARTDSALNVATPIDVDAREAVKRGDLAVAVVIPKGFGDAASRAFVSGTGRPSLDFVYDPSRSMELAVVRGVTTQYVMQAVIRAEGEAPTLPFTAREQAMTSGAVYNGYAHSFGGMAIQFLLFAMANLGVEMLLERRRGLWKRFRSAPVSKLTLLSGKAASGAIISLLILLVCFAFAMAVFGVRVHGSTLGFLLVAIACALMASTFGLLVAALGNTPATARGITTFAVLIMVMLGGAWVPTFVFPAWLQQATRVVPVRWAMDGLDAMTWRGQGLEAALGPALVLCGFAAAFAALAAARFRWEEA